jgi:flagellar motor switch/type III secretory pathway protein FliN
MSDEEENIDNTEAQAPKEPAEDAPADEQPKESDEAQATADEMADGMKLEDMNSLGDEDDDNEDEFALGEPMAKDVEAIYDIPVQISAVLGRSTM